VAVWGEGFSAEGLRKRPLLKIWQKFFGSAGFNTARSGAKVFWLLFFKKVTAYTQ
jgi:hypothetical protein